MACEWNGSSDERIGEAVIRLVIEEDIKDASEEAPPLTPLHVTSEEEKKMVTQLANMIRDIGDKMRKERAFQDTIDGYARYPGRTLDKFWAVADEVITQGITWEKIAVLFYFAGKLALRAVEAHFPQSVTEIVTRTVDFFRKRLLAWILQSGGWINSFSELAVASVRSVSSSSQCYGLLLIFIAGVTLGSLLTWKLSPRH